MPLRRKCRITGADYTIEDKESSFCRSLNIPLPTICPDERLRLLMSFRNEWKLYSRKCDKTREEILSAYKPDAPFPVYKNDIWWGDNWDGLEYGREIHISQSFFDQFGGLLKQVPREGTSVFNSENCMYNGHIRESKNCYLNSLVAQCEDTYYSYWMVKDKDVYDSVVTNNSTLCFECIDVNHCYGCFVLQESNNCRDCLFSFQLTGCSDCIFCTNLVRKNYHIYNKPCSKEEYLAFKNKLLNGSYSSYVQARQEFFQKKGEAIHKSTQAVNCENVTGDHLYDSKNIINSFDAFGSEDIYQSISLGESRDIYSCYSSGWPTSEGVHFSSVTRGCNMVAFCTYCWFCNNIYYSDSCVQCRDCFGCVGLKHKQYCILNVQYTKDEYEQMLKRLIDAMKQSGEWGEFFPSRLSPFGYNESCAQDFYPLNKEEALKKGFNWSDYEPPSPKVEKILSLDQMKKLPDNINDIPDDILSWALTCEVTGRPYRIIKQELQFYREHNLPIPRRHPDQRHKDRMAARNPRRLFDRTCMKCSKPIQTTYSPDRPEIVYCEQCYLKEVY